MNVLDEAKHQLAALSEGEILDVDIVFALLNGLTVRGYLGQKAVLSFILGNLPRFDRAILSGHYSFLIHCIRGHCPFSKFVALLEFITDSETVTQSRVNLLLKLYERDPRLKLVKLLSKVSLVAKPGIYVPITGQASSATARIPARAASLLTDVINLNVLATVYTEVSRSLVRDEGSDVNNAETLAALLPVVAASGNLLFPIEEFAYWYLSAAWPGTLTMVLRQIIRFFRFWPRQQVAILEHQLFTPLGRADYIAAAAIGAELHHLPGSQRLMELLAFKLLRNGTGSPASPAYAVVFQYYLLRRETPSAPLVKTMVMHVPAGLFLAAHWAWIVSDLRHTIQGHFSLPMGQAITQILPELRLNAAFSLGNTPWLGLVSEVVLKELTRSERHPTEISDETLGLYGLSYQRFCGELLDVLYRSDLVVDDYLEN